ncbi:MAG: hypothetical protein A2X86_03955 [Bdellovibrionales bacterium GWA2_49_15]|nr:MAG: hypothetical protein A2X86_03955 [Bdellovibrionales bacterium GWA2_49_15]HAZ12371.1 hypothetical protein [Bdellovibrionales bacterium]
MDTLERFNKLRKNEAAQELIEICSSLAWVEGIVKSRPITSVQDLMDKANRNWDKLSIKAKQEALEDNVDQWTPAERDLAFAQKLQSMRQALEKWALTGDSRHNLGA